MIVNMFTLKNSKFEDKYCKDDVFVPNRKIDISEEDYNVLKAEDKIYEKYYFTFGDWQVNKGYVQPIYATNFDTARKEMIKQYGTEWSFQYTESEWNEWINDDNNFVFYKREIELPTLVAER